MPDEINEQNETQQNETTEDATPPTEHPSGEQANAQPSEPAPNYQAAQQELINQVNSLFTPQAQQPMSNQYRQPVTAQNYQYQQPQQTQVDPELWYTDPARAEQNLLSRVGQAMQQYVGQTAQPLLQSGIENARHLSRSDPKLKGVWEKYGDEIETLVNAPQINAQFRTSKAIWDQAAQLVASRHLDDLANERAQQLMGEMRGGVEDGRSVGGYTPADPGSNEAMERIRGTDWGKDLIDTWGERRVVENCEKAGWTLDQYATMCENTHAKRDPKNPDRWTNQEIARDR